MSSRTFRALARLVGVALLLTPSPAAPSAAAARPTPYDEPVAAAGQWPLRPRPDVVRRFDPPDSPWGSGHRGVDLAGRPDQAVRAALPGHVTFAGLLAGRGVVVVDHGGTRTTYEPVAAGVAVGGVVAAGDRLGALSPVGSHCAPFACLHWGWLRGDVYLDPLLLVGAGPVRLLPLSGTSPGPILPRPGYRPRTLISTGWPPWGPWRAPPQARGCACW